MDAADWISLAQAALLVGATFFAWRGYALAAAERRDAREEARKAPLRELAGDVVAELKLLAAQAEERVPGVGIQRLDLVAAHQERLAIALAFLPPSVFNLRATESLTTCAPQEVTKPHVADA